MNRKVKEHYRRYTFLNPEDFTQHFVVIKNPRCVCEREGVTVIWDVFGIEHHVPNTWQHLEIEQYKTAG